MRAQVGGQVFLDVNQSTAGSKLSLSFSESAEFISPINSDDSCHTVPTMDSDGVQSLPVPLPKGQFKQTIAQQRGGFRFLTIVSNSDDPVSISNVGVENSFMPHWDDLTAYTGYFFTHDPNFHDPDFLTKLWYAGAYTVQTNTIDVHQARQQPCPSPKGWANNATGGPVEGPILVDGAKRDRNIWPGDMGISSHTELVALNDILPSKNALIVMFSTQDPTTGALQYSDSLVGAIVRKLSFIRIYANITYVHFLLNFGVAIWFLVVVIQTVNNADAHLCDGAGDAQDQCTTLFSFGRTTYIVLAVLVLIIELYGALIVTRYVWQLSREKSHKRQTRQGIEDAFRLEAARARYSTLASSHELEPLGSPLYTEHSATEYDPYREARVPPPMPPVQTPRRFKTFMDQGRPATPVEVGYGGGTWTHDEITEEEKQRMQRLEREHGIDAETSPPLNEVEAALRRSEIKSVGGPATTSYAQDVDELPRYPYSTAPERP
ncbi:hypothetical protein NP233_g1337 [Leucocoprinus birnbaumii]|uniref:Uncharacterized protein n=1 Tax=Leucocoprinus birnbaumii TaxID=56174 RepID=A0AAD5W499_9AGAR|nr:hypothetical protein NP233_g1337 [Leucocoprinus birnbaumii]